MSSTNTMRIWEVLIDSHVKLPEFFKMVFKNINVAEETFPYTVYLPKDKNPFTKRNDTIVSIFNEKLHIYEKVNDAINEVMFNFKDIDCIERGCVLLHSWLKITGLSEGKLISYKMDFNTVTEKLFIDLVNLIRFSKREYNRLIDTEELSKLDYINKMNYKIYSYSIESLTKGEKIVCSIFQSEIFKRINRFSKRKLSPNYSIILTDKELIVVKEEQSKSKTRENYGVVFSFLPIENINKISLESTGDEKNFTLKITTLSNYRSDLYYSYDNEATAKTLLKSYNQRFCQSG
jgi:hypothetical protein